MTVEEKAKVGPGFVFLLGVSASLPRWMAWWMGVVWFS